MDAAAELPAEIADGHEPDPLAVFLFENGHGAFPEALFERRLFDMDGEVLPDLLIDEALDPADLLAAQSGWKWVKSNRSRDGETSDPACLTCSPSTWRRAAWRRCVAV